MHSCAISSTRSGCSKETFVDLVSGFERTSSFRTNVMLVFVLLMWLLVVWRGAAGTPGGREDHEGVLVLQRRRPSHRAAHQEDAVAAHRPGGHQGVEEDVRKWAELFHGVKRRQVALWTMDCRWSVTIPTSLSPSPSSFLLPHWT